MALDQRRYERKHETILRDVRPLSTRVANALSQSSYSAMIFAVCAGSIYINEWAQTFADLILVLCTLYFLWLRTRDRSLAFKLPRGSKYPDGNAGRKGTKGKADGILYLGNVDRTNEEVWFTNSDARTHILYLGTTGAGKTEGLKSLVTNTMCWASGFVYVDGKADTDLWSSLSSLVRRFGRDDDLLVLNYMTGNADVQAPSNTMNPFSSGSASYLTNMLVSLMPQSGGDNAMWKERAVSLVGAMMPVLTWKRDHQDIPMSVRTIREYLSLNNVIKLARDEAVPREVRAGLNGYLDTLPGFIGAAYDDNGQIKPPGPDTPQYNTETASQQHGYLAMQFTRSLQSLGDDYGYIFDTQAADVDMLDIVLNRRILVVLVPALEKSGDEIANLGKIVAAAIKGMMGATLGSTVEGSSETVIENKPTHSGTPFMTVFDEVGYYVAEGMAVMAAQARSLGFCLVFSGQDLPALKKRVREEANSITANCNIKIFGKLEDPTETKEFFEKTVGSAMVTEVSGFQMQGSGDTYTYADTRQAGVQLRPRASYDGLRSFKEGQAVITFGDTVVDCSIFYSNPGFAKAMRVTRYVALPPPDENMVKHANSITKLRDLLVNKTWTAARADVALETPVEFVALNDGFKSGVRKKSVDPVDAGITALIQVHAIDNEVPAPTEEFVKTTSSKDDTSGSGGGSSGGPVLRDKIPPTVTTPPTGASPFAGFKAPEKTDAASPLAAKRPADIISSTAPVVPVPPVQSTSAAPAQQTAPAKPSIFGAPKTTDAVQSPVQPVSQPPIQNTETSSAAKPSIFGGAKPVQSSAPPSDVQQPSAQSAQETAAVQPSENKPAIFGAKPTIFAAKPTETPSVPEVPQTTVPSAEAQQPQASKPAIFGGAKPATPQEPTPTEVSQPAQPNKPSIFGGVKPVGQPPAEGGNGDIDADAEALRKAAEAAKKDLLGNNGDDENKGS